MFMKKCSNFILLRVAVQFSQNHLLKRLSFSIVNSCLLFFKLVTWCFDYCSLYILKSGTVIPSVLFFLKISFGSSYPFVFTHKFKNYFFYYLWKSHFILIRIVLNLWISLGNIFILTIVTFLIYEYSKYSHLFLSSSFSFINVSYFSDTASILPP